MKNRRYLFSLALCAMVLFVNMLSAQFADGSGTKEDPYLVETAAHLNNVRNHMGSYFLQTDDIDLTGYDWEPIGVIPTPYGGQPFHGTYDGNNYLIENLSINNPNHNYIGLFGYSIDAEFKNIRLNQISIDAGAAICVGGVTGVAANSTLSNCSVVSGSIEGDNIVGGLVGGLATLFPHYANNKLSDEASKKANSKFDAYSFYDEMIDQLLSNFVGFNSKRYYDFPVSSLSYSYAKDLTIEGSISVGGLLGHQLYSDVNICYAQNEIIGQEEVGGLIGVMEGNRTYQTYSRSSVEAGDQLGGLIGKMVGGLLEDSYSTGLVTETQPRLCVGGLIGYNDLNSPVNNSYWDTETSGILISAGGIGKTTAEMTNGPHGLNTYLEWNFFNVWLPDDVPPYLPSGIFPINDGYPVLVNLISHNILDDFFEGEGTELSPYEVSTWYHMNLMRNLFILDKYFILTDNINLSGVAFNFIYDWLPIGCESHPFTGSLEGNGYVISKLKAYYNGVRSDNIGLFGVTRNAVLSSISLNDLNVNGMENVGALVGVAENSTITDCSIYNGKITGSTSVGGIVGAFISDSDCSMEKSYTNVIVEGYSQVGGLIGIIDASNVANCYSRGKVSGNNKIGGLIGNIINGSEVCDSYSTGRILSSSNVDVGGFSGATSLNSTVENCYWDIDTSLMTISSSGQGMMTSELTYPYANDVYIDWDMVDLWKSDEHHIENAGYPVLHDLPEISFAGGDGSENSPWLISTAGELNNIRALLNENAQHFKLISNINLGVFPWNVNQGWLPITNKWGDPFSGCLDGANYEIKNLFIDRYEESNSTSIGIGLFSSLSNADILNLRLKDVTINAEAKIGSLAGASSESHISNISATNVSINGNSKLGGLIGESPILYEQNEAIVEGISLKNITIVGQGTEPNRIGGLIGSVYIDREIDDDDYLYLKDIEGENIQVSGDKYIGGLLGSSLQTIQISDGNDDCNIVLSNVKVEGNSCLGGLAGRYAMHFWNQYVPLLSGCKIENSLIGDADSEENIGGLIGEGNHIYIQNCLSYDVSVSGKKNIGGLIGKANLPTIVSCHSAANLSNTVVKGEENVGGLIGHILGSDSLMISSCSSTTNIESTINATMNFGGLIGYLDQNEEVPSATTIIENNWSNGKISVADVENIGGLIGRTKQTIMKENYSFGEIFVENSSFVGGLIGKAEKVHTKPGNLTVRSNCSQTDITVVGESTSVGGLIGAFKSGELTNSSSIGQLKVLDTQPQLYSYGGLVGSINKSIVDSSYAESNLHGYEDVGGLIGYSESSDIRRSFAKGSVVGRKKIGGLIGSSESSRIFDSYSTVNVDGYEKIGGLVGGCIVQGNSISNSYSTGKVNGTLNVGGLVGYFEGGGSSTEDSYWDTATSYQKASGPNDIGEGLMTVDMVRDNSEYAGWDFADTWAMVDYTTYPYLQWQGQPGVHNYPKHGHHKVYKGKTVYWESFPVLPDDEVDFANILLPLTDLGALTKVYAQGNIERTWQHTYWNDDLNFTKTSGYKLEFVDDEEYELTVPGEGVDYDNTTVTLETYPDGNWVGYWIPQPQSISNIFSSIPGIYMVKSENWTIFKQDPFGWIYPQNVPVYLEFGKMYIIYTTSQVADFTWPLPTTPYYPPTGPIMPPINFTFKDGPDYEVFNIESIDNDQDVIEVGVFAGDTCVGASVFTGDYPLQILAYTNASHSEEVISFAIHRSARGEDSNVRTVEVLDFETGEYYEEVLQPEAKRIATLRLGAGEEIEEKEEVIKPQFTLSQNYPNPIVMSQVSRSSELTKIDFSLPEAAEVSLNIYNIKGQLVKTLASGELSAGRHTVSWDGNNVNNQPVGSGVYFYRLDNGKKTINRKMLIVK